ncbi:hypothetical protein EC991_008186 [Linnemannia zychae]|nr:hypothetical protein EC991_008186 [Linnemannia zychae]
MEGVENPSQEFPTQEFNNRVAAAEVGVEPEFVTVTRTKTTHWVKFPVSCFTKGLSEKAMYKWVTEALTKVATIKPSSFSVTTLPSVNDSPQPFILFQVYTAHEASAACEHGSEDENKNFTHFSLPGLATGQCTLKAKRTLRP